MRATYKKFRILRLDKDLSMLAILLSVISVISACGDSGEGPAPEQQTAIGFTSAVTADTRSGIIYDSEQRTFIAGVFLNQSFDIDQDEWEDGRITEAIERIRNGND